MNFQKVIVACNIFFATVFVFSLFLSLGGVEAPGDAGPEARPVLQDSLCPISWGMRLRQPPVRPGLIREAVVVSKSPANGATVVRLPSGEMNIFYINNPGGADKLMSVSSRDQGLVWARPVKEFDLHGNAYHANCVLEDPKGNLHCIFHLYGRGPNGYRGRQLNLWYCKKLSHSRSWSRPEKIFDGYVGAIRSFIQLKNGRLVVAVAKAVPSRISKPPGTEPDYGWNDIITLYSDDQGQSWQSSNTVHLIVDGNMVTRYGGIEPAIIELNNGMLWMLIRTNKGCLYQSFSSDGGSQWQQPVPAPFISSDSPATLLRLTDGRILMCWCSDQRWDDPASYAAGGREVLHAAISRDEGKSWQGFREVLTALPESRDVKGDRGAAYGSAAETTDHKIVITSGQGASRAVVMFDPDWLEEKSAMDDFSHGLAQWTLFGDSLGDIHITTLENGRKALEIKKLAGGYGHDAVWNFPMIIKGDLVLNLDIPSASRGIRLALTDHFSISSDSLASQHGNIECQVGPPLPIHLRLRLNWDTSRGKVRLYGNGRLLMEKPWDRKPVWGVNYLRLGARGRLTDQNGYVIRSVRVDRQ